MFLNLSFLRGSLRGLTLPYSPPLYLHVQQPQPLISLRSFSAHSGVRSVVVRAQSGGIAERSIPAVSSFEQLGLGDELLSFLSDQSLTSPTEIQASHGDHNVCKCYNCVSKARPATALEVCTRQSS